MREVLPEISVVKFGAFCMRSFSLELSGYQNCCSDSGIYHQNPLKHLTFFSFIDGIFMNIGEFTASLGKKLISGDLTSLLRVRCICPGETSLFSDL